MIKIAITVIAILISSIVNGQGCSDAGVCTSGNSGNMSSDSASIMEIKLGSTIGMGEQGVTIFQGYAGVSFQILKKLDIETKVPYQYANGNLGNNIGLGDITANAGLYIFNKDKNRLYFSAGVRIPSGTTNEGNDKYSTLPMPYQTGLGTTDILTGINYYYQSWKISAGFQYILNHNNENEFVRDIFSVETDASKYFTSRQLERGNDFLFRLDKYFKQGRWTLTPGVILIYRIEGDKVIASDNIRRKVEGSDGTTLNLTGAVNRSLSKDLTISFNFGFPLMVRDTRPDGLTRSLVTGVEISYFINKNSK